MWRPHGGRKGGSLGQMPLGLSGELRGRHGPRGLHAVACVSPGCDSRAHRPAETGGFQRSCGIREGRRVTLWSTGKCHLTMNVLIGKTVKC